MKNLDDVVDDGDVRKISMRDDVFNDSISADSEITFHAKKKQTLSKADLKDDPEVQFMVQEMVKERIAEELKNYEEVFSARSKKGDKESKTPKGHNLRNSQVVSPVKSPSDTTIYRPALHKGEENANQLIKCISDIVENIRIETSEVSSTARSNKKGDGGHNSRKEVVDGRSRPETSRSRSSSPTAK